MSQAHQKHINKFFPKKAILYQPGLAIVLDSVNTAILLSQLLYWHGKGSNKDGWIYKTIKEMEAETGLSRYQQETAIDKCRNLEILDYKISGIPAKRHFRIKMDVLENILPGLKEKAGIDCPNPPCQFAENSQTNTETTQKITTQNTAKNTETTYTNSSMASIGNVLENQKAKFTKSNDFDIQEYL